MKIKIAAGVFLCVLLAALPFWVPLEGRFADRAVSWVLSRAAGSSVQAAGVRIRLGWNRGIELHGHVRQIRLDKEFFSRFPAFPVPLGQDPAALTAENMDFYATRRRGAFTVHLLRSRSRFVRLNGGARFKGKRLMKGHAVVSLDREISDRLPETVSAGMIPAGGDWRKVRMIYGSNRLTVLGAAGPMLQASWGDS